MQRLEVSGAVRPIYGSLGVKRLIVHLLVIVQNLQKKKKEWNLILCAAIRLKRF